jgi:hypothetical protein
MSTGRRKHPYTAPLLLFLALLVLLVALLMGAYALRPTVRVDVGDYYDQAFVQNFHAREVDAAGPGQAFPWPANQQTLELPGGASGDLIVTVYAADDQPDGSIKGLALSVNGERIAVPREGMHEGRPFLVGLIPAEVARAPRLRLRLEPGLREGPTPPAGLAGRVVLEPARTYRWSRGESVVALPGLGRGAWLVELEVIAAHPRGQPVNARVVANDMQLATLPDDRNPRRLRLLVSPDAMGSGDLRLTLLADTYRDPRPLGVLVSDMLVSPMPAGSGPRAVLWLFPPWTILLTSMVIVGVLVVCLASLGVPLWGVGSIGATIIVLEAWGLAFHRFPTSLMLPGIALLALWSLVLLAVLRPLVQRLFASGCTQEGPSANGTAGTTRAANILLLIFFVGYWLKAGAMFYPYFVAIDVHWHMDRVRHILDGGLPLYYGTSNPLNESTMPLAEWGTEKPVIPYSPYYHMFAAGFVLFPWSLETSANMVSVLLDCLHIPLIALLACGGGLSRRGALLAAALYAVLPVNFLLHSWGNVPTTFGLFWALAATVFIVVSWNHLHRRWFFVSLLLLFLAALLFYTVAGVFMGLFLIFFTLLLLLAHVLASRRAAQPAEPGAGARDGLRPMWLAAAAALALSLLVYYGQYIGPIIGRTIPYFARSLTSSSEAIGKAEDLALSVYLARHLRLWDYGLFVPFVLASGWLVVQGYTLWRGAGKVVSHAPTLRLWAAVGGWLAVTWLFVPLAYKVSMVDKHFFVSIPVMVVASAAVVDRFWGRWPVRVATLIFYTYLAIAALDLWIMRVATVRQ